MLSLAYSPCPNDTFMFHALASGLLGLADQSFEIELHDVETLNQWAFEGRFDITKLSFHAWLLNRGRYALLRSGAALGYGCGPLVVAKRAMTREDVARCRVAVPGELTTAHLLLRLWQPAAMHRVFLPYDCIQAAVLQGEVECGVIIHEGRFTFTQAGLVQVVDLGSWWEHDTGLPIPLGCIAMRHEQAHTLGREFEELLVASISYARSHPEASLAYMRAHAIEMDSTVLRRHVDTYVNDFSVDLGATGQAAIARLEEMARAAGVIR